MVELKSTKRIYAMKVIKKDLVMDEEVRLSFFFSSLFTVFLQCSFSPYKLVSVMVVDFERKVTAYSLVSLV